MKKFKVDFVTKSGRKTHRYFKAPSLSEAQAQFAGTQKSEHYNCEWSECPYVDMIYKNTETGKEFSLDLLYKEYVAEHPNRDISFIAFSAKAIER